MFLARVNLFVQCEFYRCHLYPGNGSGAVYGCIDDDYLSARLVAVPCIFSPVIWQQCATIT